jgi:lipopolysaccharide cholinephosphotransferase
MIKNNHLEIQNKILEIVKYFNTFCLENNIEYYLMGGSALGAMRHEGFIPWDDDFDVFMTYKNYIKFIKLCDEKLDIECFYLQKENTIEWPLFFTKLRMNGTTFIEEDSKNRIMHKGFYIDIMCLNNTHKNKIYRYLQYLSARLLTIKSLAERGYRTKNIIKKLSLFIFMPLIKNRIKYILLNIVRSLNNKETLYVGHFFGRASFNKTSFLKEYLGKPRLVEFSGIKLPVPSNVEKYLEIRYGSKYMEMPSEKTKSLYPSHFIYADPNLNYSIYDKTS